MKPAQIAAYAKVMAREGITRLQVGSVVIERPPTPAPVVAQETAKARDPISAMRESAEYKSFVRGGPLLAAEKGIG